MGANHEREEDDGWSFSQLKASTQCGERVRRRYVEGERRFLSNTNFLGGSAFHQAAEKDLLHRQAHNKPLDEEVMVEVANEVIEDTANSGQISDLDSDPDLEQTKSKVSGFISGYQKFVSPTIGRVLGVEEKLKATMQYGDHEFRMHGYVDLIDADEDTGTVRIRDWKTSKAKMDETAQSRSLQWPLYSFLARANGYETDRIRVDALRVLKAGPAHQVLEFDRGQEHHRRLARVILKVDEMYRHGLFTPDPFSQGCSPKFCEFWDTCPYRAPDDDQ